MLKKKVFFSRFELLGCFFILLLPFVLLACGGEATAPIANQTTAVTTVSSTSLGQATVTQPQFSTQLTSTQPPVAPKASAKSASSTDSGKAPKSGEEACALVTKEEASTVLGLGLDKAVSGSSTGFSCNYYSGENILLQIFFEKVKGGKSLVDAYKVTYPDAKLIPGVGDYNWWSAESSRFELFQGSSNFDIVMLSGETDKAKLLDQATKVAQLVISRIK